MTTSAASPLRTFRILVGALMGALVVIGIAMGFTIAGRTSDRNGRTLHLHAPGVWMYLVVVALGVVAAALVEVFGYRMAAVPPGLDPAEARVTALRAFQQSLFLRFAFSESVAIIAIALVFSYRSNTILPYVLAAVIAELLMAYHVWPSRRIVDRVQRRLDRNGGRSGLAAALNGAA